MDSAPDSLDCSEKSNDGQNSPPKRKQSESSSGDQGVATAIANPSISPIMTTGKSPSVSVPAVSQQTRHARRIYVGGIPAGYADEEILKSFLNAVISKGLNEENDHSYVLSVYINQKKCFTFVEFKSIELTTACLELDGLIYYSSVLKVLRANEYKPELLPPSHNPPIKLYLPASAFGTPIIGTPQCCCDSPGGSNDLRLDYTFIQSRVVSNVERDSIVLIGFPYDDTVRRATGRAGSSVSPKAIRNIIKKQGAGTLHNPEYNADLSQVRYCKPLHRTFVY
jgi:RNA recognition motif-containing protein